MTLVPTLYAFKVADGAIALWRNREQSTYGFVATIFDGAKVGDTYTTSNGWELVEYRVERVEEGK